jgi:hypothetical protein
VNEVLSCFQLHVLAGVDGHWGSVAFQLVDADGKQLECSGERYECEVIAGKLVAEDRYGGVFVPGSFVRAASRRLTGICANSVVITCG